MIHNDVNLSTSPPSPPTSDTPPSYSFSLSENHDLLRAYEQGGGGGGVAAGIPAINISIHSPNANHVLGEYTSNPNPYSNPAPDQNPNERLSPLTHPTQTTMSVQSKSQLRWSMTSPSALWKYIILENATAFEPISRRILSCSLHGSIGPCPWIDEFVEQEKSK